MLLILLAMGIPSAEEIYALASGRYYEKIQT